MVVHHCLQAIDQPRATGFRVEQHVPILLFGGTQHQPRHVSDRFVVRHHLRFIVATHAVPWSCTADAINDPEHTRRRYLIIGAGAPLLTSYRRPSAAAPSRPTTAPHPVPHIPLPSIRSSSLS